MAISMNGVTITGTRMKKTSTGFNPVDFWAGQTGGFWDFTDPASLFADEALTTPATLDASGGVLGVADLTGNGAKLTRTPGGYTNAFTMRSGYCESYVGGLSAASVPSMTAYTAIILVRPSTVTSTQALMDTDYGTSNRISQNIIFDASSVMESYVFGFGSPAIFMPSPTLVASTDYYASVATDNSGADLRVGGTTYTSGSGTVGGASVPIAVGAAWAGTNTYPSINPFSGRIYCAAWINKKCTPTEIAEIGAYMNTLAGTSAAV